MAVKGSGALSMTEIATEFGGSTPYSLSQFYRGAGRVPNGPAANAAIATAGAISMGTFYGAVKEMQLMISASTTNVNALSLYIAAFGAPTAATVYRLTIPAGVVVGGVGQAAMIIGQFPAGSIIYIDNFGSIQGFGGAAGSSGAGGNGGDAINANYPNQTVIINNAVGAEILAGGGGGGRGGTGGTGGQGYYTATVYKGSSPYAYEDVNQCCVNKYGAGHYCAQGQWYVSYYENRCIWDGTCSNVPFYVCNACYGPGTAYSSGGAGGAGGSGGAGKGYNQANTSGSSGAGGGAPGTNAGWGGTGGTGGAGGTWGTAGRAGNTGNTGGSGNYSGGSGGAAGSTFGAAGRYLVKGTSNTIFNNEGSVAGTIA